METVVLAPAGYLLDPDVGSDYERPWRLVEGLAARGMRVVLVAREVKKLEALGPNVEFSPPPGSLPRSPAGRIADRISLYRHARRVAYREASSGRALVVHHLGPCGERSPSLVSRLPVPFVYGPLPGARPAEGRNEEWLSWLLTPSATSNQERLSKALFTATGFVGHQLWRRTIRQADAVTVEAQANAPPGDPKFVVIPPGIDVATFSPDLGSQRVQGRVIAVGRLLPRKGFDLLISAIAKLIGRNPHVHLLLVGAGPEESSLRSLAAQLGIDINVRFLGNVPRSELPPLLRSAEVYCHPARWDNVPFALIEAMSCALPTLVSSAGGLPDVVGDAGRVFPVEDQHYLELQLSELLSAPDLRRQLGASARARVLSRFTWGAMCDAYLDLYRALSRRSRP